MQSSDSKRQRHEGSPRIGGCSSRVPGEGSGPKALAGPAADRHGALKVPDLLIVHVWLSVLEAAKKISSSTDTIERRAIPWQPDHVQFKIRFKFLVLDKKGQRTRRYYEPDVEALLFSPERLPVGSRPRIIPQFFRKEGK